MMGKTGRQIFDKIITYEEDENEQFIEQSFGKEQIIPITKKPTLRQEERNKLLDELFDELQERGTEKNSLQSSKVEDVSKQRQKVKEEEDEEEEPEKFNDMLDEWFMN